LSVVETQVSSLRDFGEVLFRYRRLKPTVNKVPSLRDYPGAVLILQSYIVNSE
jgi:hypothetical protein